MNSVLTKKSNQEMYSADDNKKECADVIVDWICELGGIKTAYDLGCGSGIYVQALIDNGVKTLGIDINDSLTIEWLNTSRENIQFLDLSKDITNLFEPRDIVVSIETAEHIPEQKVDIFFQNVVGLANNWIFLTASPTIGKYHLNPQSRDYWIEKVERFEKHRYQDSLSIITMNYFDAVIPKTKGLKWFKNDLMVFKAEL